ncbi:uncharacterized protein METZ01_LOCUS244207 [marine metagenome]|uniref:Uncharacterized protein n=1 Tax=marine metagenome TaxID=408172 RepID=A0A382HXL5_9ZZZZ
MFFITKSSNLLALFKIIKTIMAGKSRKIGHSSRYCEYGGIIHRVIVLIEIGMRRRMSSCDVRVRISAQLSKY